MVHLWFETHLPILAMAALDSSWAPGPRQEASAPDALWPLHIGVVDLKVKCKAPVTLDKKLTGRSAGRRPEPGQGPLDRSTSIAYHGVVSVKANPVDIGIGHGVKC